MYTINSCCTFDGDHEVNKVKTVTPWEDTLDVVGT